MVNGYKKTEIGAVPSEWDVLPFEEIFRTLSNNTLPRDQLNYDSGSIKDIHYGDILILFPEVLDCSRDDIPYVNNDASISGKPLRDGDIIISDTAEDETVGKAVEVSNQANTNIVAGLHTIPCRVKYGKFASGWLGYFINSHYYHDQLIPYIHGTKVSSITRESLADTYIVVPPYEEQEKIVAALADISRLISESEKLIAKYQSIKQSCLQHMFPRKGQTEPDMRLPGFTGAWEQRKLGDVCKQLTRTIDPQTRPNDIFAEYSMPAYDSGMKPSIVYGLTMNSTRKIIDKSCLLINKLNVRKKRIWYIKEPTGNAVCSAEFIPLYSEDIDLPFLSFVVSRDSFTKYLEDCSSGSSNSQKRVTPDIIIGAKVFLPSKDEQRELGIYFQKINNLITLHQRKCEKYKMIKQGMMEDLLTGKVRLK